MANLKAIKFAVNEPEMQAIMHGLAKLEVKETSLTVEELQELLQYVSAVIQQAIYPPEE